jgi:hypothetical protein
MGRFERANLGMLSDWKRILRPANMRGFIKPTRGVDSSVANSLSRTAQNRAPMCNG